MFIYFPLLSLPQCHAKDFYIKSTFCVFKKKSEINMYNFDECYIHSILQKINYNVEFASPEFDSILTNKPECVILRRKKNSLWCMQF